MSLKDDVKILKEELSAEEKFLESSIKAERFLKRYKNYIFATLAFVVLAIIGYQIYQYDKRATLRVANDALNMLIKNPSDSSALETLKNSNQDLYYLYLFKEAIANQDDKLLDEIIAQKNSFTSEIAEYEKASASSNLDSLIAYSNSGNSLKDLALLQISYLLIKEGEFDKAKNYLDKIPENSMLHTIASMYKHYLITKVSQ